MSHSILVVDRDEVSRKGLVALLRSDPEFQRVSEAGDAEEAAQVSPASQLTGVLFKTPSLQGQTIETLGKLRERFPSIGIIVLTSSLDGGSVIAAVKAGAKGLVTTEMGVGNLLSAIRSVARGEVVFSRQAMLDIVDHLVLPEGRLLQDSKKPPVRTKPKLTAREVEVLSLVSEGANNREIAEALVISEHTVRAHLRNILDKLRLENRIQAATWAVRMGLSRNGAAGVSP